MSLWPRCPCKVQGVESNKCRCGSVLVVWEEPPRMFGLFCDGDNSHSPCVGLVWTPKSPPPPRNQEPNFLLHGVPQLVFTRLNAMRKALIAEHRWS